jgi:hypothetical protein
VRITPRAVRWALRVAIVVVGGLQGWAERHSISPDGVSYLNLSDGWVSGNVSAGINAYWSPLYPAVLGFVRAVIDPSPGNEATLLHVVNLLFMVLSLVGFELFLSELRARKSESHSSVEQKAAVSPDSAWWDLFNYGLFAWGALELISVGSSTPDMLVAAALYFAAALTLRCHRVPSPLSFVGLGVVLGLGFLAKSPLLPIGAVWLILIAAGFGIRARWTQRLLAPALFVVVALPFIAAISLEKGRVTFADAARVNRGWYVNNYPMIWTGEPEGSGIPVHAPVIANVDPLVIAYPDGAGASYPFFDDPSYWTEGMTPRSDLRGLLRTTIKQLRYNALAMGPVVLAIVLLSLTARPRTVVLREFGAVPSVTIAMLALIVGYATIVTQTRFVAGSVVILAVYGFDAFRRATAPPPTLLLGTTAAALAIFVAFAKSDAIGTRTADVVHQSLMVFRHAAGDRIPNSHLMIADALSKAGLQRGDKVGVIGSAMQGYWARLAGLRIAAEVPSYARKAYWSGSDSVRSVVEAALWRSGARAIVAGGRNVRGELPGWQPLPVEGYFVKWPGAH